MDNVNDLIEQIEELQRMARNIKKVTMEREDFLHSGEHSIMKFVAQYENEFDKSPTLGTICDVLVVSQATVSTVADRLIKKGLLSKRINEQDKRSKVVSLTDKGKRFLESNHRSFMEVLNSLSCSLGDEDTKELIRILNKVNRYFKDAGKGD